MRRLLTSVEGIPVIIECRTTGQFERLKVRGATELSQSTFNKNRKYWTDETDIDHIFDLIDKHLSEFKCYIRKEDAYEENQGI